MPDDSFASLLAPVNKRMTSFPRASTPLGIIQEYKGIVIGWWVGVRVRMYA